MKVRKTPGVYLTEGDHPAQYGLEVQEEVTRVLTEEMAKEAKRSHEKRVHILSTLLNKLNYDKGIMGWPEYDEYIAEMIEKMLVEMEGQ